MSARNILQYAAALSFLPLLAGCAMSGTHSDRPANVQGVALKGNVFGGQQPISNSTIQLYATNLSGGYGSASMTLISASVMTDAGGNFSITGDYTCPENSYVYIVSTGGNPGLGQGSNNPFITEMAALGPCSSLSLTTFISINELTTVGTVYALSPFMVDTAHVGTTSSNVAGLASAFGIVNELVNTATGSASGPALPAGATLPLAPITTIADILSTCVNSTGGTQGDGGRCDLLLSRTTVSSMRPADTAAAALSMAKHPGNNVSLLWALIPPQSPFQPTLLNAPSDWTLAINHTGGGLSSPQGMAVDANGNLWLANKGNNSLTELNSTGAALSPSTGYLGFDAPVALAISSTGDVWVANQGVAPSTGSLMDVSASGTILNTYTGGGLNAPASISIDAIGTIWLANSGANSISAFTSTGSPLSPTGISGGGINKPVGIAVNPE